MKKFLLIVAAVGFVAWVLSSLGASVLPWIWAKGAVTASAAKPWPGGLGPLELVAGRYPRLEENAAARTLMQLASALPRSEAIDEFVRREIARDEIQIGEPPLLPDVSAIRDLLRRESVVWERRDGVGDGATTTLRATQLTVARALIASALAKARSNDLAAWEDLHAVWTLAGALDPYPQVMVQTAALSMARMVNAVAWKMPLPPPPWFAELQERDFLRRMLEAFQFQAASYWNGGEESLPTKWLANSIDKDRGIAEALFQETRSDVTAPMNDLGTDLSSVWRRVFRYRVEREATANALRVRDGRPIEIVSRCSDGGWTFDGTTLRFAREIATAAPDAPMPLVLRIAP